MLLQQTIRLPWQRIIEVKLGCEEEIRVDPTLKNCHEYPVKQEREQ